MEIVKRGTPPADKVMMAHCCECKSVLKAVRSELREVKDAGCRNEGPSYAAMCPVCGHDVTSFSEQACRV